MARQLPSHRHKGGGRAVEGGGAGAGVDDFVQHDLRRGDDQDDNSDTGVGREGKREPADACFCGLDLSFSLLLLPIVYVRSIGRGGLRNRLGGGLGLGGLIASKQLKASRQAAVCKAAK